MSYRPATAKVHNMFNRYRLMDRDEERAFVNEMIRNTHTFDFDAFVDGYIECILWCDCLPHCEDGEWDGAESGGCEHLTVSDETRRAIIERGQLREFVADNLSDLLQYVQACNSGVRVPYDASQGSPESYAGHDFYLTRAGHGAGFWDRDLGALGDRLTAEAQAAGSVDDHILYDNGNGEAVV